MRCVVSTLPAETAAGYSGFSREPTGALTSITLQHPSLVGMSVRELSQSHAGVRPLNCERAQERTKKNVVKTPTCSVEVSTLKDVAPTVTHLQNRFLRKESVGSSLRVLQLLGLASEAVAHLCGFAMNFSAMGT